ncbi:MAG: ATP-binding cassette domain-containing protein [Gemmataceae bacterium]
MRLDLEVKKGEVVGILGPNGSGKSTALRILLGFLSHFRQAAIAGHDCWNDGVSARKHAAYLPGELRRYENMTGRQLVRFLDELRGQLDFSELPRYSQAFDIDVDRPLSTCRRHEARSRR